jgi:ATP-dependent Clp protease adapter protein ClpS
MWSILLGLAFIATTQGLTLSAPYAGARHDIASPAARAMVSMQTIAPQRIAVPDTLPSKWDVPDTFSLASLRKSTRDETPLYKLTLFKSGRGEVHIVNALLEVVPGMAKERAIEVAETTFRVGFSLVRLFEQALAEEYAASLKSDFSLVCDVSPE